MTYYSATSGSPQSGLTLHSSDTLIVSSGGTATATTVLNGGKVLVNAAGSIAGSYISSGGSEVVSAGGLATSETLARSFQDVFGSASATSLISGAQQYVETGGTASSTQLASGGFQLVSSGGLADSTTVSSGGIVAILAGGSVTGAVLSGGQVVSTGTVIKAANSVTAAAAYNGYFAGNRVTVFILAGGTATGDTIVAGGTLVEDGGIDTSTKISFSGGERVNSNGSAVSASVSAGGILIVSGGTALDTTLNGGTETLLSGGTATGTRVTAYSIEAVSGGGTAVATLISAGGSQSLAGGTTISAMVASGGVQFSYAGTASATQVSGGQENVSGGVTINTVLTQSGTEYVAGGGIASGTTVNSGSVLSEGFGGTVFSAVVNSGGVFSQLAGTASGTVVNAGGQSVEAGLDQSSTISSGGALFLSSGGTASATSVSSGGLLIATSGSILSGATVMTGGLVVQEAGATILNTTSAGGLVVSTGVVDFLSGQRATYAASVNNLSAVLTETIDVLSSGTATGTVATDAAIITVEAGGVTTGTMLTGYATENVMGSATGTTVVSVATQTVSSGGTAVSTVLSNGGGQIVMANGSATGTTVANGAFLINSGGTVISATIQSGGTFNASGTDIGTIVNAGGTETAYAAVTSAATVNSGGMLSVDSGTLISGTISSGGTALIYDYSSATALTLLAGATELLLDSTATVTGTIFNSGAAIDLANTAYDSGATGSISNTGLLTVTETAGTFTQQLAGNYSQFTVMLASDGATGTAITLADAACFCPGTRIAVPGGEAAIETLSIGDNVLTASGEIRPIKWIGRRSYAGRFLGAGSDMIPILFKAGSLEDGLPTRDLYVSAMHAMLVDGVLMPACGLVNGATIRRCTEMHQVEYLHIELDSHDLLLAEGAPSETFMDCDNRAMFHNAAEFYALYPGDTSPRWAFCRERCESGPLLEAARLRIAERASLASVAQRALQGVAQGALQGVAQGALQGVPQGARQGLAKAALQGRLAQGMLQGVIQGPLQGYIDRADWNGVCGWAVDKANCDTPVMLEVLANEKVIARVLANELRSDVRAAGIGDGRCGFNLTGLGLNPLLAQAIQVRRAYDGAELIGSPAMLVAAVGLDPGVRQAIQSSIAATAAAAASAQELDGVLDFLRQQTSQVLQARAAALKNERVAGRRRLRALFMDERTPDAARDAGSCAALSHIAALQRAGYQVAFTTAPALEGHVPAVATLEAMGVDCLSARGYGSVEEILARHAGQFDLVYMHRGMVAWTYAALARRHQPGARLIYSVADLHHLRLARQIDVETKPELEAICRFYQAAELSAAAMVDAVITHSGAEATLLRQALPGRSVHVLPWSIAPNPSPAPFGKRRGVAFIGNLQHPPNLDAVEWLVDTIMPLVHAVDPAIPCLIAGSEMPFGVERLARPGIEVLGPVADLAALHNRVRLTVAPLRYGAGIKGKVLHSLAAGTPCVMTQAAAEGLALPPALTELQANSPADIAASILHLHRDRDAHRRLARAGLAYIQTGYSTNRLDTLMSEVINPAQASPQARTG